MDVKGREVASDAIEGCLYALADGRTGTFAIGRGPASSAIQPRGGADYLADGIELVVRGLCAPDVVVGFGQLAVQFGDAGPVVPECLRVDGLKAKELEDGLASPGFVIDYQWQQLQPPPSLKPSPLPKPQTQNPLYSASRHARPGPKEDRHPVWVPVWVPILCPPVARFGPNHDFAIWLFLAFRDKTGQGVPPGGVQVPPLALFVFNSWLVLGSGHPRTNDSTQFETERPCSVPLRPRRTP
ncbi:MAG: hypothetical protein VB934_20280, partial [Polyangiaceae bacterium]